LGYLISSEISAARADGKGAPQIRSFDATAHIGLGTNFKLSEMADIGARTVTVRYLSCLIDAYAGPNSWSSESYALLVGYQL